jgi:hypothetical protein
MDNLDNLDNLSVHHIGQFTEGDLPAKKKSNSP